MLASAWVGMGAGLLPRARGKAEIALLAIYGGLSALAYGMLMNLWFWPFAIGSDTDLSFVAGASVGENLHRFLLFTLATSTLGWDLGRAITNVIVIVLIGPAALGVLRRAARRAAFDVPVEFAPTPQATRSG
jgi:energy-coupling factor transport system substrate-specific component